MMNDITINSDSLGVTINELLELSDSYSKILEKIKNELQNIQGNNIWNGVDSNLFIEGAEKYLSSFENVKEVLNFYGTFLKDVSNIYKILEQDYSTRSIYE